MSIYVKYDTPKEISDKTYNLVETVRDTGKIKKGSNEVTKVVERGDASIVVMAADVDPPEILAHMPMLCEERKVAYAYVPSKAELGNATGLEKPTASIAITDLGKGKPLYDEIVKAIAALNK